MEAYSPVAADWTTLAPMPQVWCRQHRELEGNCPPASWPACPPAQVLPYNMTPPAYTASQRAISLPCAGPWRQCAGDPARQSHDGAWGGDHRGRPHPGVCSGQGVPSHQSDGWACPFASCSLVGHVRVCTCTILKSSDGIANSLSLPHPARPPAPVPPLCPALPGPAGCLQWRRHVPSWARHVGEDGPHA